MCMFVLYRSKYLGVQCDFNLLCVYVSLCVYVCLCVDLSIYEYPCDFNFDHILVYRCCCCVCVYMGTSVYV